MPSPTFFLVINAGSGSTDADTTRATIERILTEAGRPYRLFVVKDAKRTREAAQQAVKAAGDCNGVVVAVGGDGTINAVANAVLDSGCPFAALPRGTFNYFGRSQGISEDVAEATRALLDAEPQPIQVGLLNQRAFLVNASVGLYPKILEDREAWKKEFGRSRIVAFGAGLLTALRYSGQLRLTLEQNGLTANLTTPTLFISNNPLQMQQVGLPVAENIERGQLAAIAVRPVGVFAMLGLIVRGALGSLGDADHVISFSFKRLTVKPSYRYRTPRIKAALDGEVTWMNTPLEFSVSPKPLLLLKPKAATGGAS